MSFHDDSLQDLKVLIVDDNESIASLLCEVFSRFGAKPTKVLSGQAALEEIKTRKFDLLLLDVLMDDMDGWDVLDAIKEIQPELKARTIIMTGDGFRLETARKIKEFNIPVFYKPFRIEALRETACKTLGIAPAVKLTAA